MKISYAIPVCNEFEEIQNFTQWLLRKKQLAYLKQGIYNNRGYFMGRKEAVPVYGTWVKNEFRH